MLASTRSAADRTKKWLQARCHDNEVDLRLLETFASDVPYSKMSFTLWVKESCVPQELDNIFTVTKMLSLKTVVKLFFLNAELALSPLCEAILSQNDNVDTFEMDTGNLPKINTALNPNQFGVHQFRHFFSALRFRRFRHPMQTTLPRL
jgi:hypothetical protein